MPVSIVVGTEGKVQLVTTTADLDQLDARDAKVAALVKEASTKFDTTQSGPTAPIKPATSSTSRSRSSWRPGSTGTTWCPRCSSTLPPDLTCDAKMKRGADVTVDGKFLGRSSSARRWSGAPTSCGPRCGSATTRPTRPPASAGTTSAGSSVIKLQRSHRPRRPPRDRLDAAGRAPPGRASTLRVPTADHDQLHRRLPATATFRCSAPGISASAVLTGTASAYFASVDVSVATGR
ncbi:MAG: hypothetical protein IPL61_18695 [Myxococcales bacterium]|nr:hypothetical protein [Myxococcales bacterium]